MSRRPGWGTSAAQSLLLAPTVSGDTPALFCSLLGDDESMPAPTWAPGSPVDGRMGSFGATPHGTSTHSVLG